MLGKNCIFFQLAKVNQAAGRFLSQKVAPLNLTPAQAMVLGFLADEDHVTSVELGKRTELDSATLTGIIDRLETAGLVERMNHPDDRRAILIHLTPKGKILTADREHLIVEANREFLAGITEAEKETLFDIIGKLRQHGQ